MKALCLFVKHETIKGISKFFSVMASDGDLDTRKERAESFFNGEFDVVFTRNENVETIRQSREFSIYKLMANIDLFLGKEFVNMNGDKHCFLGCTMPCENGIVHYLYRLESGKTKVVPMQHLGDSFDLTLGY